MALIVPSILAADFAKLGEALEVIKAAGASMVHVEVMDGHFVPEITVGPPVIASLRQATDLVVDVHLLVERPERCAGWFLDAGVERLAVHAEATPHLHRVLALVRGGGAKAGVAVNPSTPIESLADVLGEVDFVSILTADPGLEAASFIPASVAKVRAASEMRADRRLDFAIQAEGGIGLEQVEQLARAGADILVAGSAIFDKGEGGTRLAQVIRRAAGIHLTSKV